MNRALIFILAVSLFGCRIVSSRKTETFGKVQIETIYYEDPLDWEASGSQKTTLSTFDRKWKLEVGNHAFLLSPSKKLIFFKEASAQEEELAGSDWVLETSSGKVIGTKKVPEAAFGFEAHWCGENLLMYVNRSHPRPTKEQPSISLVEVSRIDSGLKTTTVFSAPNDLENWRSLEGYECHENGTLAFVLAGLPASWKKKKFENFPDHSWDYAVARLKEDQGRPELWSWTAQQGTKKLEAWKEKTWSGHPEDLRIQWKNGAPSWCRQLRPFSKDQCIANPK